MFLEMISKSHMQYKKCLNFAIKISGKWSFKFLKLYKKRWSKFEQVSKNKSTDPSDVATFSVQWILDFCYFFVLGAYKTSLAFVATSTILRHTYVQYTYDFLGPGKRRPRYVLWIHLVPTKISLIMKILRIVSYWYRYRWRMCVGGAVRYEAKK